jgi:penicillin amidase
MRIVLFAVSAVLTIALVVVLNVPLPVSNSKTPRLGEFLSPQHGCWQNAEPFNYNFNGDLSFAGLKGKVQVYFDERLVPHVYADEESDAYFVQGYLHAKFRLWQMEFQTHAAAGRLSEVLGASSGGKDFVLVDKLFRRTGMVYGAEKTLQEMEANPTTKMEVDAYTAGVNSYIAELPYNKRPLEYKVLDYKPEPWTNMKTALFMKYMAWDLAGGGDYDLEMTNAKNVFSSLDIGKLYPDYQDSLDPIVSKGTVYNEPSIKVAPPANVDSIYFSPTDSIDPLISIKPNPNNGSNNWAVSGTKTKSGSPILCNDPHLGLNMPSLWYEMQITTPTSNCYGATFPGAPSIIIGFTDSIAWGVTNAARDVKDYYEMKFRDSTMKEYWYNNNWVQTTFIKDTIRVKGQVAITEDIAMTVFGPVIYDRSFPNKLNDNKYYALRWKAHDPSNETLTLYKLNHAKNFADYVDAISTFECPGQNFIFASHTGEIAIRQQGSFPAKWKNQGDFIMPGTDSIYAWQGLIPNNENPMQVNPVRGFVSSANQQAADNTAYPYYMGRLFSPYRGLIVNRKLTAMNNITVQDMQAMQTDNYNVFAEEARPVLLKYIDESKLDTSDLRYLATLKNWNLRNDVNEQGPTIFTVWWSAFEKGVWTDEFAQSKLPLKLPDEGTLLEGVLKDSAYKFVDDIRTPGREALADVLVTSFKEAVSDLKKIQAYDMLAWGRYKDTRVKHLLGIGAFSRQHLPIGGGKNIINATVKEHGPGWRMIVSLTEKVEAYGIYPGGQSGNPGSKFYDTFVDSWAAGKYYSLVFLKRDEAASSKQMKWAMTFGPDTRGA